MFGIFRKAGEQIGREAGEAAAKAAITTTAPLIADALTKMIVERSVVFERKAFEETIRGAFMAGWWRGQHYYKDDDRDEWFIKEREAFLKRTMHGWDEHVKKILSEGEHPNDKH